MAHRFIFVEQTVRGRKERAALAVGHIESVRDDLDRQCVVFMVSGEVHTVDAEMNTVLGLIYDATREHSR